jgi:hypothetical protein
MADKIISDLEPIETLNGDELLPVEDASGTFSSSINKIKDFILALVPFATTSTKGVSYLPQQITISNNADDSEHDLDFTAFVMDFDDGTGQALVSALTKRIDATWVAGNDAGALDTGTVANNTPYYIFAIYNPTTLVSDILFSASKTSPTLPSGYTKKAYIGACHTDGSANIRAGKWVYDSKGSQYEFKYTTELSDVSTTLTNSTGIGTLTVPANSIAITSLKHSSAAANSAEVNCSFTDKLNSITSIVSSVRSINATSNVNRQGYLPVQVDGSRQFDYVGNDASSGAILVITTGWKEKL